MSFEVGELNDRRYRVYADGRLIAAYTLGQHRPYVYPLCSPSGVPLTEEGPADHPHHQSLWLGQDEVNEVNLWLDPDPTKRSGAQIDAGVKVSTVDTPDGQAAVFDHDIDWTDLTGGEVLFREKRTTVITHNHAATTIDMISLRTATRPITLGATKEAGIGIRASDLLDENDGGSITSATGAQGEAGTFDTQADWMDVSGQIGNQKVGFAIFSHPESPEQLWFTRRYGIITVNPYRLQGLGLSSGEQLHLGVRVVTHDGAYDPRWTQAQFANYREAAAGWLRELSPLISLGAN